MRRYMLSNRARAGLAALAAALLVACGLTETAGIQGSGAPVPAAAVSGPITGFGSIFVNGVEYGTSAAQITIDGQPGTESQLRAGQIVTLQGAVNSDGTTGSATAVTFAADVRGPVTQIDLINDTFTVLGQTVQVTTSTVFDDNILSGDITGLSAGALVEVSGFADPTGDIVASRVDLTTPDSGFQIKGVMQGLDSTAHTFQINGFEVDYSAATPSGTLADGSTVLVHGSSLSSSNALLATHVEVLPGIGASANEYADLDGIITTFTSASDFFVLGQHVATSSSTAFVLHGLTLAAGVQINVKGKFDASGVLQAQKVQATPFSASLVAGLVDSVNSSSNTLSVMGVTVTTSDGTTFDDHSSQHLRTFRLSDLHAGDYVLVSGTEATPGTLDAAALTRRSGANKLYLQGTATNVADPNFTILGLTITTNAQTRYLGVGGSASGAATFFSAASSHIVLASVSNTGGVLTATAVQIVK